MIIQPDYTLKKPARKGGKKMQQIVCFIHFFSNLFEYYPNKGYISSNFVSSEIPASATLERAWRV